MSLAGGNVRVLLTRVDDGDKKRAKLEIGASWKYDIHQDDGFALLREEKVQWVERDPRQAIAIAVDRRETYQTMLGYGGAMTDASAFVLMNLKSRNPGLYRYTMTRLFSPAEGAGFSVLRLAMGASDYTAARSYYTYCDEESPTLSSFRIDRDRAFIIPALKDALALNPEIRLIASPWSAPAWMKTNHDLKGVSAADRAKGITCKLRPECFATYADYFVKFIEAYRASGLEIYAVTLQNEPQHDGAGYPCMRMDEFDQIKLVRLLGPKLAAKGLKTRILIHDHNWALDPNDRKVVCVDAKMDPIRSVSTILADPEAGKYIAGSAWHCYSGGTAEMERAYETIHAKFPGRQILTTEVSGWGRSRGRWWGDVEWGMAHNWLGAELHWSAASLEWNIALDHRFGPTLRENSEALGLVTIKTDGYRDVKFEREFYPMAQMSRAARPGARRIGTEIKADDAGGLDFIAFALPDGRTSLVAFNKRDREAAIQVEDRGAFFAYPLARHSIATFVW